MPRRYENPPLVEVLCELRFDPKSPWDMTIPGLFYDRIRGSFPVRRPVKDFTLETAAGSTGISQQVEAFERIQFANIEEKALIQLGPHLLAMNHLKPYTSWEEFLPLIQLAYEAYCDVAEPTGIRQIMLRYINRIEIPKEELVLSDYFEFYPYVGAHLSQSFAAFAVGIQIPYEDSRGTLKVVLASTGPESISRASIILDLDYSSIEEIAIDLENVVEWVNAGHSRIELAFEACINEKLREQFGEKR